MADNYGSWGTDIGHEGDAQPMNGLKGTCSGVNTQMPMDSTNSGPSRDAGSTTGNIAGWNTTSLADTGGSRGVGGNDTRNKTT